jgi:hypothetical protein
MIFKLHNVMNNIIKPFSKLPTKGIIICLDFQYRQLSDILKYAKWLVCPATDGRKFDTSELQPSRYVIFFGLTNMRTCRK